MTKRDGESIGGVRLAAVGDLRMSVGRRGELRPGLKAVSESADVLLLAGGLTASGLVSEAETLTDELDAVGVPIVAVLGAIDHATGQESRIRAALTSMGWTVLEASSVLLDVRGTRLGIAGMTGFPGGFGQDFQLWSAAREHREADRDHVRAARFGKALTALTDQGAEFRVALTHYAPVPGTLDGEPDPERPNLGNDLIGEVIDESGADLVVHAMASRGTHRGRTPGGIPAYNVSQPVLDAPYALLTLTTLTGP